LRSIRIIAVSPSGSRARVAVGRSIRRASSSASANDAPGDGSSTRNDSDNDNEGVEEEHDDDDELDDQLIDSFLRGDYDYEISDDAPSPHPGLMPTQLVRECLRSLRSLHDPTPSHGAAVLQRFLLPLSRRERWGNFAAASRSAAAASSSSSATFDDNDDDDPWRTQIMRAALTPHLMARQIRSSSAFGCLLDWTEMDVTDGGGPDRHDRHDWVGGGGTTTTTTTTTPAALPSVAHVDAVLRLEDRDRNIKKQKNADEEVRIRFTLRRIGGVWLIDTARRMRNALAEEAPPFD
jgi:hypothetical protein